MAVLRKLHSSGSTLVWVVVLAMLAFPMVLWAAGRDAALRNQDANRAFNETRFEEATDLYDAAQTLEPESGVISYNLGNALYRQERFEEATSALLRGSVADDAEVRQNSLFNLGNTFVQLEKYPEALTVYRKALELDPHDLDTKINFEKAMQMLQEQQQQQQEKGDGQEEDDQSQDGDRQDQENQDQQGDEQQEENDSEQQDQQEEQDSEEQHEQSRTEDEEEPQQAQPDSLQFAPGEMTPEEAIRILDAMRDQEKELQKERAKKAQARVRGVEKDW